MTGIPRPAPATEARGAAEGTNLPDAGPDSRNLSRGRAEGSRAAFLLVLPTLLAAGGWLIARIFIGLDFTDEMQYYGEIAGLVQTSRFFEYDLFLQQLGYVFVLPFFKLHALLFPDQSHLILFGRVLLAAAYALGAMIFWRSARRAGFPLVARLAGLAAFLAWIPFQLFAFSYNSMAYLLVVVAMATWPTITPERLRRATLGLAAMLAALTFIYPPAGIALIVLAAGGIARRFGGDAVLPFVGFTAACGVTMLGAVIALHGTDFLADLLVALRFTRSFNIAQRFLEGDQPFALGILLAAIGGFLWRLRGAPRSDGETAGTARTRRQDLATLAAVGIGSVLWFPQAKAGYAATAVFLALLVLAAPAAGSHWPRAGLDRRLRRAVGASIAVAGAALIVCSVTWAPSGYFATTVFMLVLAMAAATADGEDRAALRDLAITGAVLGTVFAATSGNGLHNFGLGGAAMIPGLVLRCARVAGPTPPVSAVAGVAIGSVLVAALLLNGAFSPSLEKRGLTGLAPLRGAPAFAGISVSQVQRQTLQALRPLLPEGGFAGKRVLIAGPHPWLYFATGARPATPMFFMHFSGPPATYELVAARLFRTGPPDAILITNGVPAPIQARLLAWANEGCAAQKVAVPAPVREAYERQTNYELSPEVLLLTRRPQAP